MQRLWISLFVCFWLPAVAFCQLSNITVSGVVKDRKTDSAIPYVTITLTRVKDSSFVAGTITDAAGRFSLSNTSTGEYILQASYTGYKPHSQRALAGSLSPFLDLGLITLEASGLVLNEVVVTATADDVTDKMDKKSFAVSANISQGGGSILQALKNLPGITTTEDGQVQLRGSSNVMVLIDGKQTALSGFGNQAALDNIPASAIERIEIINNPSARYDANGTAGIINIIYKKTKQEGLNGKIGFVTGVGALWEKRENLPGIRPQYQATPKVNPSLSLNYRKRALNLFFQGDYLYNKTLNKNDFTDRYYANSDTVRQQVKRNRITTVGTAKVGADWQAGANTLSVSGLYSNEHVRDRGDIPFYNSKLTERRRLWQFYEDEYNTAATASATFQHRFGQPGHLLNISVNYTFHREDEKYFLTNSMPSYTGKDTFMLIADEHVTDLSVDYIRPLKRGRIEGGLKFRQRRIPTNMQFFPGLNSPLDTAAAGWARYEETIPAVYGNYVFETKRIELEAGLRLEYVNLKYQVNPNHNTYTSDGYSYAQPFPSVRVGYKLAAGNKLSFFYNRRVDRPDEGDIRIFPKYDDPEILKVGNPALKPQFTNTFETGYKRDWAAGYLYTAFYYRTTNGTITRIGTVVPGSSIIYFLFQNAGRSSNAGIEAVLQHRFSQRFSFNANGNVYRNRINAFTVENQYPVPSLYTSAVAQATSGNVKLNALFHFKRQTDVQLTALYLAPDIVPQGKIYARFSVDAGLKRGIQKGKGELFANASDLLNTLRIKKEIRGNGFTFYSTDYYETQVFRIGYSYKF